VPSLHRAVPLTSAVVFAIASATTIAVAAEPAPSPEAAEVSAPPESALYLRGQLGLGYWHYFQDNYADREIGGGGFEGRFAIGRWFSSGFTVGGEVTPIIYFPSTGHNVASGNPLESGAGGGIMLGIVGGWLPDYRRPSVAVSLAGGFLGSGVPSVWGGYGPYISPSVSVFFAHLDRVHLGAYLRLVYAPLFSSDATPEGAEKNFFMGTIGFDTTFL
jgi:hypothetical protein